MQHKRHAVSSTYQMIWYLCKKSIRQVSVSISVNTFQKSVTDVYLTGILMITKLANQRRRAWHIFSSHYCCCCAMCPSLFEGSPSSAQVVSSFVLQGLSLCGTDSKSTDPIGLTAGWTRAAFVLYRRTMKWGCVRILLSSLASMFSG